jgi:hypothetical protein
MLLSYRSHRAWPAALAAMVAVCAMGVSGGRAWAVERPGWEATSRSEPTNLVPGRKGTIQVLVFNVGASASGGPITVTDTLPAGVTATTAGELLYDGNPEEPAIGHSRWDCTGSAVVTCTSDPVGLEAFAGGGSLPWYDGEPGSVFGQGWALTPIIGIAVDVAPGVSGVGVNRVAVAGGGAAGAANSSQSVAFSLTPAGFGVSGWDGWLSGADGSLDARAGSHPYAVTADIGLPSELRSDVRHPAAGKEPRDIAVSLPAGLTGDPAAVARCTRQQFGAERCPAASQVGRAEASELLVGIGLTMAVYNMVPPSGVPAEFGFQAFGIDNYLDVGVRSGSDYGVTTHSNNIVQAALGHVAVTLWGAPGDTSHETWRTGAEGGCGANSAGHNSFECSPTGSGVAFLTAPVACEGPRSFSIFERSWQDANLTASASFQTHDSNGNPVGFGECEQLRFEPSLSAGLDTARADTPAGLTADAHFNLEGLAEPEGLAPSDMKDATVTLPEGLVVNPGQATGLVACGETEASLAKLPDGEENNGPAVCPAASRIGSVKIKTPLLEADPEKEVLGSVYILQSNPPEIKILIAGSADGVNIKQVGVVHLDEATGRLVTTFKNTPQQPVSDIELSFNGGPQAALNTPRACGSFAMSGDFTPWSTPFTANVTSSAVLGVSEGVGGGACPNGEPFSPSMVGGMLNNQAGAFSPLSITLSRQDTEQDGSTLSVTTPPGLLAILKSVERCPEPQASQGACGPGSQIGHVSADVGAGPDPFQVQGGRVYLTGPYKGAPFGLSVVVPAVAGPFNLGNVIVRAAIYIDPHTAQPTIVSDALPTILDGVPLQVKRINVTIDREAFMFNPTNCEPLAVTGTVTSTHGATAPISSRFQAANCAALAFKPSFKVSTQAKTSKKNGASLTVNLGYPQGPQANIHSVAVTLPKQLPSRLSTIQQACTEAAFDANPASCPPGSNIGFATARTPVLASPVTGPAYLVSHGGAAFPNVVLVLQSEGVTLDLIGSVNIKHQITGSAFASVPDAPISSFQLTLPEGPHSALSAVLPAKAKGNICATSLTMPTTITGQNGAVIKQNTKITVTGCPKTKQKTKAGKHTKHKGKK